MGIVCCLESKDFLWRLYNNILPTCKNLSRNIQSIQLYCPICSNQVKDVVHVFFQCQVAEETWISSPFSHLLVPFQGLWPLGGILALASPSRRWLGKAILDSHPKVEGPARAPKRSSRGRVMSPSNGCHW
ncbi:hypothetical protein M9H77_21971 [Catharanthus roseus]|uniref:Uncharacterized protein n=1 Tax=Catharanthus roseus TaxID=4058 RepID=A0ACC0AT69_CATRO|nr:hypothetical protein M9H77_21971 [Catharanthus roseus]